MFERAVRDVPLYDEVDLCGSFRMTHEPKLRWSAHKSKSITQQECYSYIDNRHSSKLNINNNNLAKLNVSSGLFKHNKLKQD